MDSVITPVLTCIMLLLGIIREAILLYIVIKG